MAEYNFMNKSEFVYEALWDKIILGEIQPGRKFSAQEIADMFRVSRTPVYQALKKLEDLGAIKIYPNVGFELVQLSWKDVEERNSIELLLEKEAIGLMKGQDLSKDIERLRKLSNDIEQCIVQGNQTDFYKLTRKWHVDFISMSKSQVLIDIFCKIWDWGGWLEKVRTLDKQMTEVNREHDQLLTSLEKGDFPQALELLETHSLNCLRLLNEGIVNDLELGLIKKQ